jgi:hypothetical protein
MVQSPNRLTQDAIRISFQPCIKVDCRTQNLVKKFNNFTMTSNGTQARAAPLTKTGALDGKFKFEDTTPVIGREYPEVNIVEDLLGAPDADELIRDLAITSKSCVRLETTRP